MAKRRTPWRRERFACAPGFAAICLACLGYVKRADGVLADGFLSGIAQVRVAVAHDLSHAELRELLGDDALAIEKAAFERSLILHESGDDFGQVFAADAAGFGAGGHGEADDFEVELARLFVGTDVFRAWFIAFGTVVEAFFGAGVLRCKFEARGEDLLHQEAGGDGFQRVVDGASYGGAGGIGFGDQVSEAGAFLAGCVAGGTANDLHNFGEAAAVSDGERVFAPDPIEAFLGHAESDDDVDVVTVIPVAGSRREASTLERLPASLSSTRSATLIWVGFVRSAMRWNPVAGSTPCHSPRAFMISSTSLGSSLTLSRELTLGDVDKSF